MNRTVFVMTRTVFAAGLLALLPLAGCGGDPEPAPPPAAAPAAPTTETVLDTTGAAPDTTGFFDEAEAEAAEADTHTHDDGTTHDH
jgi:hypothetical protein